jgi:hypothetical protein
MARQATSPGTHLRLELRVRTHLRRQLVLLRLGHLQHSRRKLLRLCIHRCRG